MADQLREVLDKALSDTTNVEAPAPEAPTPEAPAPEAETTPEQVEAVAPETPETPSSPTPGEESEKPVEAPLISQEPDKPWSKAPASWKGDAKEVWDALPEKARKEVMRRERQINQTLQETAEIRHGYQAIQQVAQEFAPKLKEWNAQPHQVIREFMEADRNLSSGPMSNRAAYMAKLIKEYDIDIQELDTALSGAASAPSTVDVDARVQALVRQALAPIQERLQQDEQAQVTQVVQSVSAMEDNPKYPHFDIVREDMADLIEINFKRGIAISLDDAYNRTVGYKGLEKPQQRQQEVRKAVAASVSVGGSPTSAVNAGNPKDLRGTILKAFDNDSI